MSNSVSKEVVGKYKSKTKFLEKYREAGKKAFEESSKLSKEVDRLLGQNTSLVTVRDPTKGTLNLVVIMGDKVVELKADPKRIPTTDMINLHQGISEYLYIDVLQDALQISKLMTSNRRVEEML